MSFRKRALFKVIVLGDSGLSFLAVKSILTGEGLKLIVQVTTVTWGAYPTQNYATMLLGAGIWDTAGQERFQSLGVAFYRGADCCVLVYDVNVLKSFDNLENWHKEFLNQASPTEPDTFPFMLLGNKIDVDGGNSRVVSELKATTWCKSKGIPYFETSAKGDYRIDAAFLSIARSALKNQPEQDIYFLDLPEALPESEPSRSCCRC